jgi:hypothetical protein
MASKKSAEVDIITMENKYFGVGGKPVNKGDLVLVPNPGTPLQSVKLYGRVVEVISYKEAIVQLKHGGTVTYHPSWLETVEAYDKFNHQILLQDKVEVLEPNPDDSHLSAFTGTVVNFDTVGEQLYVVVRDNVGEEFLVRSTRLHRAETIYLLSCTMIVSTTHKPIYDSRQNIIGFHVPESQGDGTIRPNISWELLDNNVVNNHLSDESATSDLDEDDIEQVGVYADSISFKREFLDETPF